MDPTVVDLLAPFIVTSWHGHRDSESIPAAVQAVWRQKFSPGGGPGPRRQQSNVDLAVLSPSGDLVHTFDGFVDGPDAGREPLAARTARELRTAISRLGTLPATRSPRASKLPDLGGARGMRVFVTLDDDRMTAYQAPIVEAVALSADDWSLFRHPDEPRDLEASALVAWLGQIYPPGVMERVDPVTKRVYRITSVTGALRLTAAGAGGTPAAPLRYALLSGGVRLTDEGPDAFSYSGHLDAVITYSPFDPLPRSVRGTFEAIYPRHGRPGDPIRRLPLLATFESLPVEPVPPSGH